MDGGREEGSFLGWASCCENITEGATRALGSLQCSLCGIKSAVLVRESYSAGSQGTSSLTVEPASGAVDEDVPCRHTEPVEG